MLVKNASRYRKPVKLLSSVLVCSKLGALRINLAAQFWTCRSLLIMYRRRPAKRELQQSRRERTREMKYFFAAAVPRRWRIKLMRRSSRKPLVTTVYEKATLRASLSGTFLQTLPDLVTPLKGHSLFPRSCPTTRSAPSERFGYCRSNLAPKHARKHETHPPRVKRKKFRLDSNDFGFI